MFNRFKTKEPNIKDLITIMLEHTADNYGCTDEGKVQAIFSNYESDPITHTSKNIVPYKEFICLKTFLNENGIVCRRNSYTNDSLIFELSLNNLIDKLNMLFPSEASADEAPYAPPAYRA